MKSVKKIMHLEGIFTPSKEIEGEYDLAFTMPEGTHAIFHVMFDSNITDEEIGEALKMDVDAVQALRTTYNQLNGEPYLISKLDVIGTFCEGDILYVSNELKKKGMISE